MKKIFWIVWFVSGAAFGAPPEPMTLKGVSPGMTIEEVEKVLPNFATACSPPPSKTIAGVEDASCMYSSQFGYQPEMKMEELHRFADHAVNHWVFYGREGRVLEVDLSFFASDFADISRALKAKYGRPALKSSILTNRMGVKFENITATWSRGSQTMVMERYHGSVEFGRLWLVDSKFRPKPKLPSKDL